ncbi:hypothetical protein ACPWT1_02785 [Ramlibacter sp. MMS24-I3-19]|uniref:hypothetical protein n=1 Tax=Ramlibacter sp. MMS24-I3-19 TaxID=3416606 RepID=UPI003D02DD80
MLRVQSDRLLHADGERSWGMGHLETPTLAELRERVRALQPGSERLKVSIVRGTVQELHASPPHRHALFQAASQFNLLEMVSQDVSPEDGVARYEHDATQGPACAIAAGAGTIFRNYLADLPDGRGQSRQRQIDCLADLGMALGNARGELWSMCNGYAMLRPGALEKIDAMLAGASALQIDRWRDLLRIGLHWNVQVTLPDANDEQYVSQAYCSALPVAYNRAYPEALWARFATLVLEGTYEATLLGGALNFAQRGSPLAFLTSVGGGAFGNDAKWIATAIRRSFEVCSHLPLDVRIVAFRSLSPEVTAVVRGFEKTPNTASE